MRILVIGATGGTGQAIVREAVSQSHQVTALVRSKRKAASQLEGVKLIEGDALDPDAMAKAMAACDGVICSLGPKLSPLREITLLSDATHNIITAMRSEGLRRFVCITGMGAGDSKGHGGFLYDRIIQPLLLGPIYRDKDRQEAIIRASGLDWTIVRPTVLTDAGPTNTVRALTDLTGFHGGKISRADVGRFIVSEFSREQWVHDAPLITAD